MEPTAAEIAAAVRSGALTARAAVEGALTRIAERDKEIGAFQVVRAEAALREADELDARADRADLPLAGVPIAIKDTLPVAGEPMRVGSTGSDPTPQTTDHEVVRRLRAAGAIVVGLTRVPELCIFGSTDSAYGITRNPRDLTRTPGGSSGGSAAAVASGMVPIAHGTDGMGSIRIPSACCGLVGLKPGLGVVPADLGANSWFDMAESGPIATTVQDASLMLSVLAGDPSLAAVADPGKLRIALSTKVPGPLPLDKEWRAATEATGELLRGAGFTVTKADPPYGQTLIFSEITSWTVGTELDARLLADRKATSKRTRRHAAIGNALQKAGLPRPAGRRKWRERATRFFADYDVLVTPALARKPIKSIAWAERGWLSNVVSNAVYAPFAAPWNFAGWPAMAVPAGVDSGGRPLAIQLVGKPGSEATLLSVAARLEELRPWERTAP